MSGASAYGSVLALAAGLGVLPVATESNVLLNFLVFMLIVSVAATGWNLLGG